jgi:hypothetical protein
MILARLRNVRADHTSRRDGDVDLDDKGEVEQLRGYVDRVLSVLSNPDSNTSPL